MTINLFQTIWKWETKKQTQQVISNYVLLKLVFQMLTSVKWMKGAAKGPVATLLAATTASVLRAGDWGLMARHAAVRWTAWCWCAKKDRLQNVVHSSGASITEWRWIYLMFKQCLMFQTSPTHHTSHILLLTATPFVCISLQGQDQDKPRPNLGLVVLKA